MHPIAKFMQDHGLSQSEFARIAGISQPYLNDMIHLRLTGSLTIAFKLCKLMGISLDEFYSIQKERHENGQPITDSTPLKQTPKHQVVTGIEAGGVYKGPPEAFAG